MRQAMRIMGHQFVMGRTIDEALERSLRGENARYRYSFDMLGEAALTAPDAERYLAAYTRGDRDRGTRYPGRHCRGGGRQHLGQAVRTAPTLRAQQSRSCA